MEEAGGINLYGFVNNSPANFLDVLGFDAIDQYWQQNGQGGMGGGNQVGPSTITGVWGIQGDEANGSWNEAQDALVTSRTAMGQTFMNFFGGQQSASQAGDGWSPPDIGQAIGNFLGGVVSDVKASVHEMVSGEYQTRVELGTPYEVPLAANPFISPESDNVPYGDSAYANRPAIFEGSAASRAAWEAKNGYNQALLGAVFQDFHEMGPSLRLGANIGNAAPYLAVAPLVAIYAAPAVIAGGQFTVTAAGALIEGAQSAGATVGLAMQTVAGRATVGAFLAGSALLGPEGGAAADETLEAIASNVVGETGAAVVSYAGYARDVGQWIGEKLDDHH